MRARTQSCLLCFLCLASVLWHWSLQNAFWNNIRQALQHKLYVRRTREKNLYQQNNKKHCRTLLSLSSLTPCPTPLYLCKVCLHEGSSWNNVWLTLAVSNLCPQERNPWFLLHFTFGITLPASPSVQGLLWHTYLSHAFWNTGCVHAYFNG